MRGARLGGWSAGSAGADLARLAALDLEGYLIEEGLLAPPVVCASVATFGPSGPEGRLVAPGRTRAEKARGAVSLARDLLASGLTIVGANNPYDFGCLLAEDPSLIDPIFKAYAEGRVHDVQVAQALHAIACGNLGVDPRTGARLKGSRGGDDEAARYKLDLCVALVLGRDDAKAHDEWRLRYALLADMPVEDWPETARTYPVDDVVNPLEVAAAQLVGGGRGATPGPHRNLADLRHQCEAHWAMHLGAMWGIRVDGEAARELRARVERDHAAFVRRFARFFKPGGKEDGAAVKRAVAAAYGGELPPCPRCVAGKVLSEKTGNPINCQACAGTGLELSRSVPRTPAGGVQTDRDTLAESGDPELVAYGDNEPEKIRETYLPWLEQGVARPLTLRPNVLVASGRTSYDGLIQLLPRQVTCTTCGGRKRLGDGPCPDCGGAGTVQGVRECIRARGTWLLPRDEVARMDARARLTMERVFCSVDYAAIELCTLAQFCLWVLGWSKMADAIRSSGDPGMLHTAFGASLRGWSPAEMAAAVKGGDKVAKNYRWAAKACFHPDVEILTRRGWVRVSELAADDEVAAVDPSKHVRDHSRGGVEMKCAWCRSTYHVKRSELADGHGRYCSRACSNAGRGTTPPPLDKEFGKGPATMRVRWERPLRLTARKATEGLVRLKSEGVDLRVTPDHGMLAYGSTNELSRVEAKNFGSQRGWFNAGRLEGGTWTPDARLLRLAVATQADGSYAGDRIRFGFKKTRKAARLKCMLREGEYTQRWSGEDGVTSFTLSAELTSQVKALLDDQKQFTFEWLDLTGALRDLVLNEVVHWDATLSDRERFRADAESPLSGRYFTTQAQSADVVQALAAVSGRKTRLVWSKGDETRKPCARLTLRDKADTRGGLTPEILRYDGDVYCLTVSTGYVLVRDGGVPVVVGQCNFGLPGGMGPPKFVFTQRKKSAGSTTSPDGAVTYPGLRFCILLGGAERCSVERASEWRGYEITPVCRACLEIVARDLRPAWFREWSEIKDYHAWVSALVDSGGEFPCLVPGPDGPTASRMRGGLAFPAGANNGFQALAADGAKAALRALTRECYTGLRTELDERLLPVVESGPPRGSAVWTSGASPLLGTRPVFFAHDEIVAEMPLVGSDAAARRMSEVMVGVMSRYVPDVPVRAEPALMHHWSKNAEAAYDGAGRLVPWDAPRLAA